MVLMPKEEVDNMPILEWVIESLQFAIQALDNIVRKYLWRRRGWEA